MANEKGFYQDTNRLNLSKLDSNVFKDTTPTGDDCVVGEPQAKSITINFDFNCSSEKLVLNDSGYFTINLPGFGSQQEVFEVKNYTIPCHTTFTGSVSSKKSDYKIYDTLKESYSDIYYDIKRTDPDETKVYMNFSTGVSQGLIIPKRGTEYDRSDGRSYDYYPVTMVYKNEEVIGWNAADDGVHTSNKVKFKNDNIPLKDNDYIYIEQSGNYVPDKKATWAKGDLSFYRVVASDGQANPYPLERTLTGVYLKSKDCKIEVTCAVWPDSDYYNENSRFTKDGTEIRAKQTIEMNVGHTYTFSNWHIPVDADNPNGSIPINCRWEKITISESATSASEPYPHLGTLNISCYFIANNCFESHKPKGYVLVSTNRI